MYISSTIIYEPFSRGICTYKISTETRMKLLLVIGLFGHILGHVDCLTCLFCTDVAGPEHCPTTRKCGSHESCFSESYIDPNGYVTYTLGCRDNAQCVHGGKRERPVRTPVLVCQDCCTTNLCNAGLCGGHALSPPSTRGPVCYDCPQHSLPGSCHTIKHCGLNEVCSIKKTFSGLYESSCKNKQICQNELNYYKNSFLIGRRSGFVLELSPANTCFMKCCDDDLCNGACGTHNILATPSPTSYTTDHCQSNPCVFGTCSTYLNDYRCTCNLGAHGRNCDQMQDPCLNNPCYVGTCHNVNGVAHCACAPNYHGTYCDQVVDPCQGFSCGHGTCHNYHGHPQCTCNLGYDGTHCDYVVDPCQGYTCTHGTCHSTSGRASCTCNWGYTGTHCDQVVDPCQGFTCTHGVCHSTGGTASCTCNSDYTGIHCDQAVTVGHQGCTGEWLSYGGHCYLVKKHPAYTWQQANTYCRGQGAYLAEVTSSSEATWMIRNTIDAHQNDWWLGGTRHGSSWRWNSGSSVPSYGWGHGEPDSTYTCLVIHKVIRGWADDDCNRSHSFVCEK